MLDYFVKLVSRAGHWSYLLIFAGAALESAAFVGLLIPGESLMLVSGFLAAQGVLDLDVLIWTIAIGAIAGDSIGYEMGRRLGRPALLHYGSHLGLNQERVDQADEFFKRHGGQSIFLGRFVGFAHAIVPFLAGSSRMRYRVFLPYNLLGAGLWSSIVVLLGYFLGDSWHWAKHWIGTASAVVGGTLFFTVILVWLYRAAVRNEKGIQRSWQRFLQRPEVLRFRLRFARQIAFIKARLSPGSYLGLRLTMGAVILIGASWLFGGIAEDVLTGDPLTIIDVRVASWFHEHATPAVTRVMLAVTHLNGPLAISVYATLVAVYLAWKRNWYWLACLLATVPSGMLLNVLMKFAFHRARPSFEHPILSLTTYSFPSGHAAGSTLFFGLLGTFLISRFGQWRRKVLIAILAIAMATIVSFSRVYLGAHYLSDVLAGMTEGVAWLSLCLVSIHTYWEHRAATRTRANAPENRVKGEK
ncbi:bifunctional DedA family/phosphatase PAP2 family protein [Noviherbaspirillum pedocola]|uniref:Bifunctional DedA family/phosphatase PAP2 family protein n=1 Tax=Noviherbaspirillum pedocola TaxID=2801341 RepID=A0A934W587_9BURK|nr:bifunctional DedA family/phosphatase PAP2 family protein [Noviherbaspirillum pedocola]MBK4734682.1 bifunctional DedA family/phosphatase PAP2 family protein [Noviherbaspirillum pedocola]